MTHQFNTLFRALPAFALWSWAAGAMAANPLGFAVAAAPSMFVLAVAEADSSQEKATQGEEPRRAGHEASAVEAERGRQAVAAPVAKAQPDERKITLR